MENIIAKLEEITRIYYEGNDDAHGFVHIREVAQNVLDICENRKESLETIKLCLMAAYIHDIFTNVRDTHHQASANWVLENSDRLRRTFEIDQDGIQKVSDACLQHRASYKGNYSSLVSEIVSAADRGSPSSLKKLLERSKIFGLSHLKLDEESAKAHACAHMPEKYGRHGYAAYNDVYKEYYGSELETLWTKIDGIDANHQTASHNEFDRLTRSQLI
jgi:HD superfamily phosphodiesterase